LTNPDNDTCPAYGTFTGEQNAIESRGIVKKIKVSAAIFALKNLARSCTRKRNLKRQSNMIILVAKICQK
jgi:hypothetical protein